MSWSLTTRTQGATRAERWDLCGAPGPWLVVVPHDDDLVLGMGLAVQHALGHGIAIAVAVVSDGRMGYADPRDREGTPATRQAEMIASCDRLGLPASAIHELGFPDGDLFAHRGCKVSPSGAIGGIAYRLTGLLRELRPRSVFGPTRADLHPDHVVVAEELAIACFHASGEIWLELGAPIALPARFDYAVYCAFPEPPTIELRGDAEGFERKLAAIASFASQRQISSLVAQVRAGGALEYLQQSSWQPYQPARYRELFANPAPSVHAAHERGAGFRSDCERVLPLLEAWPPAPWAPLVEAFRASQARPVMLIGEGSSRLFPAALAKALALSVPRGIRFEDRGGREAASLVLADYQVLLVSNSGRTRELIELLEDGHGTAGRDALALVGVAGGTLPALVPRCRVLLESGELAVAATLSVVAQALTIAHALCAAAGIVVPWAQLRLASAQAQQLRLPEDVRQVQRVWWSGAEQGASGELALKTMETAGITGIHLPGTLVLHGIEEVLHERDLVVLFFPDPRDLETARRRIAVTGARMLVVGETGECPLPWLGVWSGIPELIAGWRLLEQLAKRLGADADHPRRARKVGNERLPPPA